MSDALKEYRFVGGHAEGLEGGRSVEPGEFTGPLAVIGVNQDLIESQMLVEVPNGTYKSVYDQDPPEPYKLAEVPSDEEEPEPVLPGQPDPPIEPVVLAGDALVQRAQELDIEGRSTMTADELRAAVSAKEQEGGDS